MVAQVRHDHQARHGSSHRMQRTVNTLLGPACLKCRRQALFSILRQRRPLSAQYDGKSPQKIHRMDYRYLNGIMSAPSSSGSSPSREMKPRPRLSLEEMNTSDTDIDSEETGTPYSDSSMDWKSTNRMINDETKPLNDVDDVYKTQGGYHIPRVQERAHLHGHDHPRIISDTFNARSLNIAPPSRSPQSIVAPISKRSADESLHNVSRWPTKVGKPQLRGLINPSAWCYRRSLLQLLFAVPHFYNVLSNRNQNTKCDPKCVTCALRCAVQAYHTGTMQQLNHEIRNLDDAILKTGRESSPAWRANNKHNQDDAHHFLLYILGTMEVSKCLNKTLVDQVFHVAHEASWTCKNCNKSHSMSDPAGFSISLAIHGKTPSLRNCMDRYHIEKGLEIRCDKCKSNKLRDRTKRIISPPEVFVVHLARFAVGHTGKTYKVTERVELPETFDLSPWLKEGQTRTNYKLQSVVYHVGSLSNGHYIARVRGSDGISLLDDESHPRRVHGWWTDSGNFTPYILLYSRI